MSDINDLRDNMYAVPLIDESSLSNLPEHMRYWIVNLLSFNSLSEEERRVLLEELKARYEANFFPTRNQLNFVRSSREATVGEHRYMKANWVIVYSLMQKMGVEGHPIDLEMKYPNLYHSWRHGIYGYATQEDIEILLKLLS